MKKKISRVQVLDTRLVDVNVFFIYARCCTCVGTTSGISTGWGINGLKAAMLRRIEGAAG